MYKCVLLLLILIAPMSFVWCQSFDAQKVLPQTTLLYYGVDNGKQLCEEMRRTGLWKLFESKEWRAFFKTLPPSILKDLRQKKQEVEKEANISAEEILKSLSGQIAISLLDLKMAREPIPVLFLSWDMGTQKEKLSKLIEMFKLQILMNPKFKEERYDFNKNQVTVLHVDNASIYFAYHGNTFLACLDKGIIEKALSKDVDTTATLSASPSFQAVKKKLLEKSSGTLLYVNVKQALKVAEKFLGPKAEELQGMLQMSGLNSIDSLGASLSFPNGHVRESLYVHTPGGRSEILGKLLPTVKSKRDLTKFIPHKSLFVTHGFFDPAGILGALLDITQKFNPHDYEEFLEMEQGLEKRFKVNLRKDLLAHMSTEFLFTGNLNGGLIPDIAIQFSLKDEKKFAQAFEKLQASVPQKHRFKVKWNAYELNYFNYSTARQPIPVAPTFVIHNGRLLVTLFPESAKSLLSVKNGKLPPGSQKFLADRKHTYLEYFNFKQVLGPIYRTVVPLLQAMVPRDQLPLEFALLPTVDVVEKHLDNLSQILFLSKDGILLEWHSPFGMTPLIASLAAIGAATENKRKRSRRRGRRDRKYPRRNAPRSTPREKRPRFTPKKMPPKFTPKKMPPKVVVEPKVETKESNDTLRATLLGMEESRYWKSSSKDATVQHALRKVSRRNSKIRLKIFAPIPKTSIAHGNWKYQKHHDNLGTNLLTRKSTMTKMRSFGSWYLKDIVKGTGYTFSVDLMAPPRSAAHLSLKGSFDLVVGVGAGEIKIPYKKITSTWPQIDEIPGVKITFNQKVSKKNRIAFDIKGNMQQIASLVLVVNGKEVKSYSRGTSNKDLMYYSFRKIDEKATVVLRYWKSTKTKQVTFDIQKQKLP